METSYGEVRYRRFEPKWLFVFGISEIGTVIKSRNRKLQEFENLIDFQISFRPSPGNRNDQISVFPISRFHVFQCSTVEIRVVFNISFIFYNVESCSNVDCSKYAFICYMLIVRQRPFTCMKTVTTQPHGRHTQHPNNTSEILKYAFQHINNTTNHIYKCQIFQKCQNREIGVATNQVRSNTDFTIFTKIRKPKI
jgi:hypothetical protein